MPLSPGLAPGSVPPHQAGLAAGIVNSALQVGSAVSAAAIGSLFFTLLGTNGGERDYGFAFAIAQGTLTVALFAAMLIAIPRRREEWTAGGYNRPSAPCVSLYAEGDGGCQPALTQARRTKTAMRLFSWRLMTVARPQGVRPRMRVPSSLQVKCSHQDCCRGLNSGTRCPVSGSSPSGWSFL